jgi:multidrug resistance efflux pump
MMKMATHRGEQEQTVEAALARVRELELQRCDVESALDGACRAGAGAEMVALKHKLGCLAGEVDDAQGYYLGAQRRHLQSELDQLDREIAADEAELEDAEGEVRSCQLHVARANIGLNQHFLRGMSGVLLAPGGGPGVQELGE